MKDLNDLMQAILDMDAAQRKATEAAKAERAEQLGRLDAQRRAIADDFAAPRLHQHCMGTVDPGDIKFLHHRLPQL